VNREKVLRRYRISMAVFIAGLVLSGLTAFPLLSELRMLCSMFGIAGAQELGRHSEMVSWFAIVHQALEQTYAAFPWMAYGTDWLAFAHIAIAVFFIGPLIDPVKNGWVVSAGLISCAS